MLFTIFIAYLLGSLPFGYLLGLAAGKDVRQIGSKNIGFTNVFRLCGWRYGLPTLILDVGKGFTAAYFVPQLFNITTNIEIVFIGLAALLGNIFPVWLKFKGGKGVATGAGIYLALLPNELLMAVFIWATLLSITHVMSLSSLMATLTIALTRVLRSWPDSFNWNEWPLTTLTILTLVVILITHTKNIQRLRRGEENKFNKTSS
ncbi:MAG: acyl-phosphate glycerol 3-phosphate acyltransferase [Candidatus Komeilibacteria bacterium CG_4_10_14_0_2_um_filter_37_10]|uniref:Glycerol-3-phosphate acyltransferase n=1 Tax=Candidatus Komeilibacteria bacterium CG_4_10_14_0_2_um_filter_37_10 TaxID=1974470 RepID=A0A2M7VFJ8_9BACT|nr:MAG: acyl-phosphate glycerol 3-phosphate acyltransferase [Candidatus Komeilibacteria bacterium CG_4_10_14_0_2_um_filter_37_10]PJA94128.1 MAG: acyl-phosphate glycerol 3-phosphate acyltransferase [Candidatus Komeilibacteria bacterium CG_4_9_14_3_um_filter_37_5]